jgi:hypothetical protein
LLLAQGVTGKQGTLPVSVAVIGEELLEQRQAIGPPDAADDARESLSKQRRQRSRRQGTTAPITSSYP